MIKSVRIRSVLFLMAALTVFASCEKEQPLETGAQLRLRPAVSGLATKSVAASDSRDENNLGDHLDVFFRGVDTPGFWREFHLKNCDFTNPDGELLSGNWMDDGFKPTEKYNVYVLVNGPEAAHRHVGSYEALLYLTHTDDNIYRVKDASEDFSEVGDSGFYTTDKALMMDCSILNWQPTASTSVQTIDLSSEPLRRAAAKIEVNISFDGTFLNDLLTVDKEKPGFAMFKYDRFAFTSAAFSFGAPVTPDIRTGDALKYANGNTVVDASKVYSYKITTYSYARSWAQEDAALDAPSVLVSIPFVDASSRTTYHYYRIPVCAPGVHALERNHIYRVNATLSSKGSWIETGEIPVNLTYSVLDWTALGSDVNGSMGDFFEVNPVEQAIWGDGAQTVTLKYSAPKEAALTISSIPSDALRDAGATAPSFATTHTVSGNTYQAFYLDDNGTVNDATIDGISINSSEQTITVTSSALTNRAPKYIRFRVTCGTHTQDIYLRHFPSTHIQNIPGWFSYMNDTASSIQYTFKPKDDGWGTEGIDYFVEGHFTKCASYEAYRDDAEDPGKYELPTVTNDRRTQPASGQYHRKVGPVSVEQAEFHAALADMNNRRYANGASNAVQGASDPCDTCYYYGTDPVNFDDSRLGGSDPPETDYFTTPLGMSFLFFHYWKYDNYYKVTYYTGYARRYFRYASSYSWARWIPDSQTPYSPSKSVADEHMYAKVYDYDENKMYKISQESVGGGQYHAIKGDEKASVDSNNHMYVIQASAVQESVVSGKPIVDPATFTSSDNVISPAFMLASQLGACDVSTFKTTQSQAPSHCARYVETTKTASGEVKTFTGWRLPTQGELNLIATYQSTSDAMATVLLTGNKYAILTGDFQDVGTPSSNPGYYVRCVRDLTPEEVSALNKIK